MKLKIANLQRKITIQKKAIKQKTAQILRLQHKKDANLSIAFVDDKIIKQLNKKFLNKNQPTDVLAFDLRNRKQPKETIDAEIIISAEAALQNSKNFKTTFKYEILLYLVHGILHICGYDDRCKKDKQRMRKRESYILKNII